MPVYKFKVRNKAGEIQSGESKVESKERLLELFNQNGLVAIEVVEQNAFTDISQISFLRKKVKLDDLAQFCRQMSIMLHAGISLAGALDVIKDQDMNPTLQSTVKEVYLHIQKGMSLSMAMGQFPNVFPSILLSMIEAGEVSGQLDGVFTKLAEHFEKQNKQRNKVKGAMTYPIIVLIIALLVIVIMIVYVIPMFGKALGGMGVDMPAITQFLLDLSDFVVGKWYIIVMVVGGAVALFKMISNNPNGRKKMDALLLKIPLIKDVTQTSLTASLTSTLSTLLSSGVLIIESLEIIQKIISNAVIKEKMNSAIESIKQGRSMYRALSEMNYFPSLAMSMVRTGEESGSLDETLRKAADFYDEQVDIKIQKLTTFIEPLIMVVLGGVVMFIMFSVMYPMISVYQTMGM